MDQGAVFEHKSISLDSLPTDVLIAIFSRLPSLADLGSAVLASRSLHQCFQLHKRAVLLGMLSHDFEPVMRDAVAAATTPRTPGLTWWGREQRIRLAMQRCQSLGQGTRSTADLQIDEIISALRLKAAASYFVDLFFEFRWHDLRRASPAAAAPLSSEERQRLSAAFLRHHLATTLHPKNDTVTELLAPFFSTFSAWEAEQIHQAHVFLSHLCLAMDFFLAEGDIYQLSSRAFSGRRYLNEYIYDLASLRKAVKSAFDSDPGLASRVSEKVEERYGKSLIGGILYLNSSHDFPNERMGILACTELAAVDLGRLRALRSEVYLKERGMPALVAGPSVADPPFGWVDALDGLDCCRWGRDLPPAFPYGRVGPDHYREADMKLKHHLPAAFSGCHSVPSFRDRGIKGKLECAPHRDGGRLHAPSLLVAEQHRQAMSAGSQLHGLELRHPERGCRGVLQHVADACGARKVLVIDEHSRCQR
ncbi:hypothetical protein CPLU01_13788 [Colletotrichum plurivorum]|uniref:F-box domain-containing protein n=1 Tax=Colletotrichum plurivorum TaxID=2175906 RepID=A0A8H6JPQ2_9PEZI|nr:hypothetical protein CPLU01_13788 [Colletotrichum plurivorum]